MIVREEEEVVKVDGKSMEREMRFELTTFCLGSIVSKYKSCTAPLAF
jgi:hypothetical protein